MSSPLPFWLRGHYNQTRDDWCIYRDGNFWGGWRLAHAGIRGSRLVMTGRNWADRAPVGGLRSRRGRIVFVLAAWVVICGLSAGFYRLALDKTWGDAFGAAGIAMAGGIIAQFVGRFVERKRGRDR